MSAETIVILAIFILLYVAFLLWYGGRGKPLSQAEVDALLLEMQRRAGKQEQVETESPSWWMRVVPIAVSLPEPSISGVNE